MEQVKTQPCGRPWRDSDVTLLAARISFERKAESCLDEVIAAGVKLSGQLLRWTQDRRRDDGIAIRQFLKSQG